MQANLHTILLLKQQYSIETVFLSRVILKVFEIFDFSISKFSESQIHIYTYNHHFFQDRYNYTTTNN
jgi:hypothetical protein